MKCPDSLIRLTLIFYISCLLCTTTLNFFQVQSRLEAFLLYGTFHLLPFLSRILHPQILTELSLSSVLKYHYTLPIFSQLSIVSPTTIIFITYFMFLMSPSAIAFAFYIAVSLSLWDINIMKAGTFSVLLTAASGTHKTVSGTL